MEEDNEPDDSCPLAIALSLLLAAGLLSIGFFIG